MNELISYQAVQVVLRKEVRNRLVFRTVKLSIHVVFLSVIIIEDVLLCPETHLILFLGVTVAILVGLIAVTL